MSRVCSIRHWPQQSYRRFHLIKAGAFDAWNHIVDRRISVTVGSILIIYGIGSATKHVHTHIEFYALVAQILPVLMVVAAVEGRYFRERDDNPPFNRFVIRGFWIMGLMGIGAALAIVARGHDSVILRGLVIYGLTLVGILASVYAIYGPARVEATQDDSDETSIAK